MIKEVVSVANLKNDSQAKRDLNYWLSKSPEERLAAVEFFRRQIYGENYCQKIQKVIKIKKLQKQK